MNLLELINSFRGHKNPIKSSGGIAIARDFSVVISKNRKKIELIGYNPDFRPLHTHMINEEFIKVAAGFDGYMALSDNGHVYVGPPAREFQTGEYISYLDNVIDIVGCEGHTVALHKNGRVTCIDEPASYEGPEPFADDVSNWGDITQIACGFDFVAGLKTDGTLISVGKYYNCPQWIEIANFDAFNCYYGRIYTIAVLKNGKVVADFTSDVENWKNVISVRVGNNGYAVGLKKDGTAYALGDKKFIDTVQKWKGIIDIECKFHKAVAVLNTGETVSVGFPT